MRIIAFRTLKDFFENSKYSDSEMSIRAWYQSAKLAKWSNSNELKQQFSHASVIGNGRVVFNIKGNDYRLVVAIDFAFQAMYIRFIGTHSQYDKIDPKTI